MAIMDRDEFWAIVDRAREGVHDTRTGEGAEEVAERVGNRLTEQGRDAAVAFDLRYDALGAESYDWPDHRGRAGGGVRLAAGGSPVQAAARLAGMRSSLVG